MRNFGFKDAVSQHEFQPYAYQNFEKWIPIELKEQVQFISFESFVAGTETELNKILNLTPGAFPKKNTRFTTAQNETLVKFNVQPFQPFLRKLDRFYEKFDGNAWGRFSKSKLNVSLTRQSLVQHPDPELIQMLIQEKFIDGINWLRDNHGIDYS
jgi:hypothetical protein